MGRHGFPLRVGSEYLCLSRGAARELVHFLDEHPDIVATAMTLPTPARVLFPTALASVPGLRMARSALMRSRLPDEALSESEWRRARGSGAVFLLTSPDAVHLRAAEPGQSSAGASTRLTAGFTKSAESVRSLAESGVLSGERGSYWLAAEIGNVEVPTRTQPLIAARIDHLELEAKQVLQTAAVIGKDSPYALLSSVAEMPQEEIRGILSLL